MTQDTKRWIIEVLQEDWDRFPARVRSYIESQTRRLEELVERTRLDLQDESNERTKEKIA